MLKIRDIGWIKKIPYGIMSRLHPLYVKRSLNVLYHDWKEVCDQSQQEKKRIWRYTLFDFRTPLAFYQWIPVFDRQFGGSSFGELLFNTEQKRIIFQGSISAQDKEKLISYPFIGILQKYRFFIKSIMFNALAITLKSDGLPIDVEIGFNSPYFGRTIGNGRIISKNQSQTTYELPFINFQLNQEGCFHDKGRTVDKIMQEENNGQGLQFSDISFRLQGSQNMERKVSFKKIELVKTQRGTRHSHYRLYRKPYFYITDPNQTHDQQLTHIDTGDIIYCESKKNAK